MSRWPGRLLRNVHAGERKLLWNDDRLRAGGPEMQLTSPAFERGTLLPLRFAGEGVGLNKSPPPQWRGALAQTQELVLVLEGLGAPLFSPFVHLMLFGISPKCTGAPDGVLPDRIGINTFRQIVYAAPRALPGHGPHRYAFQPFALGRTLDAGSVRTRSDFRCAASGAVRARGRLDAIFERF